MTTLKSLRTRIGAIHSTKKITKAMKLVSSAKYLNTKNVLKDMAPYYKKIEAIAQSLLLELDDEALKDCLYVSSSNDLGISKQTLLIMITSDKGLCGNFNVNVMQALTKKTSELQARDAKYKIFCIGNKGFELVKKHYPLDIIEKISLPLNIANIEGLVDSLITTFQDRKNIECYLIYNEYKSQARSKAVINLLLPFKVIASEVKSEKLIKEYEPAQHIQLLPILKRKLYINIKVAIVESIVSEHLARMLAMDNATNNAQEMVEKLTLLYNRTRQSNITRELIEIISGAEALNAN